jgi:hypothetical protein
LDATAASAVPIGELDTYQMHKFGLVLRVQQPLNPAAPGSGPQTPTWTTALRYLDTDNIDIEAQLDNGNSSNGQMTGACPNASLAPALDADHEAILVELPNGWLAFHTPQGLQAWAVAHHGSWANAPIVRVGFSYHQHQLNRLGLAFGVNLNWGD